MSGGLGDTLGELAGDVAASLDVWPCAQHVLEDTERQRFGRAGCGSLAHHGCVHQTAECLIPKLA